MSEWIKWNGRRAFSSDAPIIVRFRNGKIAGTHAGPTILPASSWNGLHSPDRDWPFDIVEVMQVEG